MATTRWVGLLKAYLAQCGIPLRLVASANGAWVILRDDYGVVAAVLIGGPFPPRNALRRAVAASAPETRIGG